MVRPGWTSTYSTFTFLSEGTSEGKGTSVGAGSPECIVLHYILPFAPAHSGFPCLLVSLQLSWLDLHHWTVTERWLIFLSFFNNKSRRSHWHYYIPVDILSGTNRRNGININKWKWNGVSGSNNIRTPYYNRVSEVQLSYMWKCAAGI
jgi:hypothetical protein